MSLLFSSIATSTLTDSQGFKLQHIFMGKPVYIVKMFNLFLVLSINTLLSDAAGHSSLTIAFIGCLSLNRQKGAKGLDEWLPPKNQCQYIARFERIRKTYGLDLSTSKEREFIKMEDRYCG